MAEITPDERPVQARLLQRARELQTPWRAVDALVANGARLRVLKCQGTFAQWHAHDEDECYVVLEGALIVELEGLPAAHLGPGDAYVVRAGVLHRPFAAPVASVLLVT